MTSLDGNFTKVFDRAVRFLWILVCISTLLWLWVGHALLAYASESVSVESVSVESVSVREGYSHVALTPQTEIQLVLPSAEPSASLSAIGTEELWLGVQFRMQPGWKIYWQQPGAGGKPPQINWSESRNIQNLTIAWPKPERFFTYGLLSYGYADMVVLPIRMQRQNPELPIKLHFVVDFFICDDICIPDQVTLSTDWPMAGNVLGLVNAAAINDSLLRLPKPYTGDMRIHPPTLLRGDDDQWRLSWSVESPFPHDKVDAFFDGNGWDSDIVDLADEVYFQQPLISFDDTRQHFIVSTEAVNLNTDLPVRLYLDFVENNIAQFAYVDFDLGDSQSLDQGLDWSAILYFAVLGGLIINIMPCVFPVLMLKVFSISRHMVAEKTGSRDVRPGLFSMALGVITSFAAMGGIFVFLRQSGVSLHWGMQFQQPLFLSAMIFVLVLFVGQLWGCWFWRLPVGLGSGLTKKLSAIENHTHNQSRFLSDFCAGVLATILATPCSAPLIGVAIGVALFVDNTRLMIIFTSMGFGMALPYVVLMLIPRYWWLFPKPGAWMQYGQWFMGVGVLLSACWVAWLLAQTIGVVGAASVMVVAGLMLLVMLSRYAPDTKITRNRGRLVLLLMVFGIILTMRFDSPATLVANSKTELSAGWQPFVPGVIDQHIQDGKVVLVDISASWCVTCVVNDQRVFSQPEIAAWREQDQVIAMRGDWSKPNPVIERYLHRYQRRALPFTIVYSPLAPEGILLPELLSMDDFVKGLARARVTHLPD